MLKQLLGILYVYVDTVEPFVMLLAALLYLIHFFFLDRRTKAPLMTISAALVAISAALTVAVIANRFLM